MVSAIIVAAGSGSRMKSNVNKQFLEIGGIPVLVHTLMAFEEAESVDEVIVVTSLGNIPFVSELAEKYDIHKISAVVQGGAERRDSVRNGLECANGDKVLIHDGARPLITPYLINAIAEGLDECDAVSPGVKVKDTIKMIDEGGKIIKTVDRRNLVQIQTPQGFKTEAILKAHRYAFENDLEVTDDCALFEELGMEVLVIDGEYTNLKITTPEDLIIAEGILREKGKKCE